MTGWLAQNNNRRAWRWAMGWAVVILFLSCLPYIAAMLMAPPDWHFAGFLVNPYDGHSYLAKMRQGFAGNWLFHLTYTPEPHDGAFIFTFYLALGHLARLTGLPFIVVFHLARLLSGFILLLTAWRFVISVTPHPPEQRLAYILLCTASGLGWLGVMFNAFPIDLWVPEAFVPYSLFANPHFPLAMALMLVILQTALPDPEKNLSYPSTLILAAVCSLLLAFILPFALLTVWAIWAVYWGWLYLYNRRWPWPQSWLGLSIGLASAPVIGYDYWVSAHNPILAGWSAQNVTLAPSLVNLVLGYGLVGLLAGGGGWLIVRGGLKTAAAGEWLVLVWAVVTIGLVYFPFFDLQRRLINGLHLPLCILAAMGLTRWLAASRFIPRLRHFVINGVVITGLLGTGLVWTLPLFGLLHSPTLSETSALFFLRGDEEIIFTWLRENSKPDDIILASPRLGMFTPGQTGRRAFYGHPFETINGKAKKAMVEAFYRGEIDAVTPLPTFIIYGPSERALGQPKNLTNYQRVFNTPEVAVYKVNQQ